MADRGSAISDKARCFEQHRRRDSPAFLIRADADAADRPAWRPEGRLVDGARRTPDEGADYLSVAPRKQETLTAFEMAQPFWEVCPLEAEQLPNLLVRRGCRYSDAGSSGYLHSRCAGFPVLHLRDEVDRCVVPPIAKSLEECDRVRGFDRHTGPYIGLAPTAERKPLSTLGPGGCERGIEQVRPNVPFSVVGCHHQQLECSSVAGGESEGVPRALLARCDVVVRIPMAGFVASYNLQAAVAILAVERLRQRGGSQ